MNNWETCPVCKGTGNRSDSYIGSSLQICTVCNGMKIINSFTGLPPKSAKQLYQQGLSSQQIKEQLDNRKGGEDEA